MRPISAEIEKIRQKMSGALTDDQRELVDQFYGYIKDWRAGHLDVDDVMSLCGGSYVAAKCVLATGSSHPLYDDVQEWLDLHIKKHQGPGVQMGAFWVSEREIVEQGGRVIDIPDRATGEMISVAQWPTGYAMFADGKPDQSRPIFGGHPVVHIRKHVDEEITTKPVGWAIWNASSSADLDSN